MIFQGKTNRCHPAAGKPDDCLWTHTESHWQSVKSYLELIKIIIPYKTNMIKELNLPEKRATILKHDLHFTHKDEKVLQFLRENYIYPLFVPAGCTDVIQECDVVVNIPFKTAVRSAFRDHLDKLFEVHKDKGLPLIEFSPKLTMGALKPFLTGFVQQGIQALKTPEMKLCIKTSFANDGLFAMMRSPEMQLAAQLEGARIHDDFNVEAAVENEENAEELGATSDADDNSDDD
jgi:hypothetical protein